MGKQTEGRDSMSINITGGELKELNASISNAKYKLKQCFSIKIINLEIIKPKPIQIP